jgi:hypothetical protein
MDHPKVLVSLVVAVVVLAVIVPAYHRSTHA